MPETKHEKWLTQEQLINKWGTNKACISKVLNHIKDVHISTL